MHFLKNKIKIYLIFLSIFEIIKCQYSLPTYNNSLNIDKNRKCISPEPDVVGAHSLFVGCVTINDHILYRTDIDKMGRFYTTRNKIIEYPGIYPSGHINRFIIHGIRAYDLIGLGKGGSGIIVSGGVGQDNVKLLFQANGIGSALKYRVEIYGQ